MPHFGRKGSEIRPDLPPKTEYSKKGACHASTLYRLRSCGADGRIRTAYLLITNYPAGLVISIGCGVFAALLSQPPAP